MPDYIVTRVKECTSMCTEAFTKLIPWSRESEITEIQQFKSSYCQMKVLGDIEHTIFDKDKTDDIVPPLKK